MKKASLLSASLCPTAMPASTDPATSTWTNSGNQSTEPLAENPTPHTQLGAAIADDGYQGRPFPQLQRPSFLQPGPGRSLLER